MFKVSGFTFRDFFNREVRKGFAMVRNIIVLCAFNSVPCGSALVSGFKFQVSVGDF
jgi:hypothetical protein